MKSISSRVVKEAKYVIKTKKTIREVASVFKISKSTVHIDLTRRLKGLNRQLYEEVKKIFLNHLEERHIRGGESTRKKYENLK